MKPTELVALLQECYRDRLALVERHKAVAVHVSNYDANNTYQYVINREETHLQWLGDSLVDLGAPLPANPSGPVDHARAFEGRVEGGCCRGRARRRRVSREVASARGVVVARPEPDDAPADARRGAGADALARTGLATERPTCSATATPGQAAVASSPAHAGSATDRRTVRVAIALGSNLGDREAHADRRGRSTSPHSSIASPSHPVIDTAPVGVPGPQPRYPERGWRRVHPLGPRELLARLHDIEARIRPRAAVSPTRRAPWTSI